MRVWTLITLAAATLAAGCGSADESDASLDAANASAAAVAPGIAEQATPVPASGAAGSTLAGRTREVANPDSAQMVLLYYNLAGLTVPVERWAEQDTSVQYAKPVDKAAARQNAIAKIRAGAASMADVGLARLTMDASLSDFDPTYSEFTVRALAPSSVVSFDAFGEKVGVTFDNAQKAQRWSLAPAEAQAIRDRIESPGNVILDVLVRFSGARASPQGGTITATVVDYELRNRTSGTTIARNKVTA